MTVRDELLRAAVYDVWDRRDTDGRLFPSALVRIVQVHALAPLVEYAVQLEHAVDSEEVITAAFAEREQQLLQTITQTVNSIVDELVEEVVALRREVVLLGGRVAALEPWQPGDDEPDLDPEPDLRPTEATGVGAG